MLSHMNEKYQIQAIRATRRRQTNSQVTTWTTSLSVLPIPSYFQTYSYSYYYYYSIAFEAISIQSDLTRSELL